MLQHRAGALESGIVRNGPQASAVLLDKNCEALALTSLNFRPIADPNIFRDVNALRNPRRHPARLLEGHAAEKHLPASRSDDPCEIALAPKRGAASSATNSQRANSSRQRAPWTP